MTIARRDDERSGHSELGDRPPPAHTGVRVLDRSVAILLAIEAGATSFTEVARSTGYTRPTTHRLLKALLEHGLVALQESGGYVLGPMLRRLGSSAVRRPPLRALARPALEELARVTGESAQLYVRTGDERICVDAVESKSELRTIVTVGGALPLTAGSAGKAFMAWTDTDERARLVRLARQVTSKTPTGASLARQLEAARRRGWTHSAGEREAGVASLSAPVIGPDGELVAVVSLSGPQSRLGSGRARALAPDVLEAADRVETALRAGRS
jgi:DNA-binding IclR family transcriptional regulator